MTTSNSESSNLRTPKNNFNDLNPEQQEEQRKIEAMAAEAKRIKEIGDAQRTFDKVEKISLTFDDSKDEFKEKDKQKPLLSFTTYKYSKPTLHEAIILNGLPYFITYDPLKKRIKTVKNVEESNRILKPPNKEEYPYTPYEFADAKEIQSYFDIARNATIDLVYERARSIVKKYNDQDEYKQNLLAIDIVWSYRQDCFSTTHYIGVTGENDSGKSSIGNTFEAIGYRVVNMTNPSASNIFRTFGTIEAGQCTLVLDEADGISDDPDILNLLKSGYDFNKKVPRTNTNTWNVEWFYAYCFKIIIAERSPSKLKAKGVLDRTLLFSTFAGDVNYDIKEVQNPKGDQRLEKALAELLGFRKLMLIYRLIHFSDSIIDLDVGVRRRNKELCKPYLRLFYGSIAQKEIEQTFQFFLDAKNAKKSTSLEAILIPVIIKLVEQEGLQVYSSSIWKFIKNELEAELSTYEPDKIDISDHTIYKTTISKILEDKFGAILKHTNKGNMVIFNLDKLRKIETSYNTEIRINVKPLSIGEGSEGYLGNARTSKAAVAKDTKPLNLNETCENNENYENISKNCELEDMETPSALHYMPSHPSHPSLFKCYYPNCDFHTNYEREYRKHGALKHPRNPLLYPSKAEIEKYGLTPQGKIWEK